MPDISGDPPALSRLPGGHRDVRRRLATAVSFSHPLPRAGTVRRSTLRLATRMNDLIRQNFGILIAYILPGFVVVSGAAFIFPPVRALLTPTLGLADGVESTAFVALATLLAGMSVSSLRWLLVDTLHHRTGLRRPDWDDAKLQDRLPAFSVIVENHYRYYQSNANLAVAFACVYVAWRVQQPPFAPWADLAFLLIECLFLATSRDNLRKYYARTSRLLGTPQPLERSARDVERQPPSEARRQKDVAGEGRRQEVGEDIEVAP